MTGGRLKRVREYLGDEDFCFTYGDGVGDVDIGSLIKFHREQEVLELIARGFSYAEIARLKSVSVHTVQTHIKNLYGKLAVHSKSEAVYEATRMGLLSRL